MHDWESMSHVRWECKYHVVFIPKYRHKVFYGRARNRIGPILRDLCRQKGLELINGPNGAFLRVMPPFGGLPQATPSGGGT